MTEVLHFGFEKDFTPREVEWPRQRVFTNGKMREQDVKPGGYLLGDHDLPVARYRAEMEKSFTALHNGDYPVEFMLGETGSGKTTNYGVAAVESGLFEMVYQSEPRIALARSTRNRIVSVMSEVYGQEKASNLVGFACSTESVLHPDNKLIIATHGYVTGDISHRPDEYLQNCLLIVDEFHDREVEGDTVLETGKARGIPAIVTSATIDAESLAAHHSRYDGTPAPILTMEGRTFPIVEKNMEDATAAVVAELNAGRDVLYLLSRVDDVKAEESRIASRVKRPHVLLQFHGEQSRVAQERVAQTYDVPKAIIATKIGGTGHTFSVDTVVMTDMSRLNYLKKGVSTLGLHRPPESEIIQAIGRISRDRPGVAIHAPYHLTPKDLPPNPAKYNTPEITRSRVDGLIVRLGTAGLRLGNMDDLNIKIAKKLEYKDLPDDEEVERSLIRLRRLGALSVDNMLTETAYEMSKLNVDVELARMIISSRDFSEEVHRYMIIAASVAQNNGVVARTLEANGNSLSRESRADMLRDLDVYLQALNMSPAEHDRYAILPQRIERVIEYTQSLYNREGIDFVNIDRLPNETEREQLLQCMATGIEEIFVRKGSSKYRDSRDGRISRQLMGESAIRPAKRVAGTPWNLETVTQGGKLARKYFITRGMEVDMAKLPELVPDRCRFEERDYEVNEAGEIMTHHEIIFDETPTRYHVLKPAEAITEGLRNFVIKGLFQEELKNEELLPLAARKFRKEVAELRSLEHRAHFDMNVTYLLEEMQKEMERDLPTKVESLEELLDYVDSNHLRAFLSNKDRQSIKAKSPEKIIAGPLNGVDIIARVTYDNQAATIHVNDFLEFRALPSYLPELDGRKVFIQIGSESKTFDFYDAKEKYSASRSDRRKTSINNKADIKQHKFLNTRRN